MEAYEVWSLVYGSLTAAYFDTRGDYIGRPKAQQRIYLEALTYWWAA